MTNAPSGTKKKHGLSIEFIFFCIGILFTVTCATIALYMAATGQLVPQIREVDIQSAIDKFPAQAFACAKEEATKMLKSPSTVEFPFRSSSQEVKYVGLTEGKYPHYTIESYLDAQNGFGAMIRSNYSCHAYCDPEKNICICKCAIHE